MAHCKAVATLLIAIDVSSELVLSMIGTSKLNKVPSGQSSVGVVVVMLVVVVLVSVPVVVETVVLVSVAVVDEAVVLVDCLQDSPRKK